MSNDRHLYNDNGAMGTLLRRVTLASLGLDAMEDVSEQSIDVLGRADRFVERLLTGVSRVMPKGNTEGMGLSEKTDAMLNRMFSTSQGPKRATDVGEWQYWLDAVLLMLFDEDEEEAELFSAEPTPAILSARSELSKKQQIRREEIRTRVLAMKASGVKPSAIQSLSVERLRTLSELPPESLAKQLAIDVAQDEREVAQIGETLSAILWGRTDGLSIESFAQSKLGMLRDESSDPKTLQKSTQILARLNARSLALGKFEDVEQAIVDLSELGVLSPVQTEALRAQSLRLREERSAQKSASRFALKSIQMRTTGLAARIMNDAGRMGRLTQRAMTRQTKSDTQHDIVLYRAAMHLSDRLDSFNTAIQERVLKDGENAASLKWKRAVGRFERLAGLNAETDRVLLRDMVESAIQLEDEGFVVASHIKDVVRELALVEAARSATEDYVEDEQEEAVDSRFQAVQMAEHQRKQFTRLVSRVDDALNRFSSQITDIGFSDELSHILSSSLHTLSLEEQGPSALQQMSDELERFVARATSEVTSPGYDLMSSDGVFISQQEASDEVGLSPATQAFLQRESAVQAAQAYAVAMAETVNVQREASKLEIAKQLAALEPDLETEQREALEALKTARDVVTLERIQSSIETLLDAPNRQALSMHIETVKRSEAQLLQVQKQVTAIENAARLASGMRRASEQNAFGLALDAKAFEASFAAELSTQMPAKTSVQLDGDFLNGEYLSTLGHSLETYAKLRDNYQSQRFETALAGMGDARLSRMLSLMTAEGETSSKLSSSFDRMGQAGVTRFGYDEVVGTAMSWVQQIKEQEAYASSRSHEDLTAIYGPQKASQQHVLELGLSKDYDISVLSSALTKAVAQKQGLTSIHSYSIDAQGDAIKLSVNAQARLDGEKGLALRQSMGQSHMPSALRGTELESPVAAQIDVERFTSRDMVSGAESFTSVILGAQAAPELQDEEGAGLERSVSMPGQGISMKGYHSDAIRSTGRTIADTLDAQRRDAHISAKIAGVEYRMTPDAFVQVLAKPSFDMASMSTMTQGSNALYAGYSAMLSEYGEQRSLKTLRKAYFEALSQSGAHTARAGLGFNSQSFVSILGADTGMQDLVGLRASGMTEQYQESVSHDEARYIDATPTSQSASVAQTDEDRTLPSTRAESYESAPQSEYRWVTHSLQTRESASVADRRRVEREQESRHVLDRIDHLLDYVEDVSSRNVGVFSTNEAVRVLVEALPADSYLGERGLPKWRQKNAREQQASEARALREALRKIGANPVQGAQRFADKRFVSPNLMPQTGTGGRPLFSGGSETGSTPSAPAGLHSKTQDNTSIPDNDLSFIAEEVYQKIIDSLNEEIQRRRSE